MLAPFDARKQRRRLFFFNGVIVRRWGLTAVEQLPLFMIGMLSKFMCVF